VARTSPIADESALLGRAVAQLRNQGDPAAALAILDDYDARFPRGLLAFDALAARVDALVRLGRGGDALARLERVPAATLDRSAALRVLRGELRAGAGRLAPAIQDFDAALALGGGDELAGRALYGRGSCRARLGDAPGARADFERYLRLFPRGRFAAEAGKALGR
jgi:tetratricopeptide (TPR) repeat protein